MKRVIEKTDDGSATLFVPELNEHYHSTKGARTESQHIFINMGLKTSKSFRTSFSPKPPLPPLRIFWRSVSERG